MIASNSKGVLCREQIPAPGDPMVPTVFDIAAGLKKFQENIQSIRELEIITLIVALKIYQEIKNGEY